MRFHDAAIGNCWIVCQILKHEGHCFHLSGFHKKLLSERANFLGF